MRIAYERVASELTVVKVTIDLAKNARVQNRLLVMKICVSGHTKRFRYCVLTKRATVFVFDFEIVWIDCVPHQRIQRISNKHPMRNELVITLIHLPAPLGNGTRLELTVGVAEIKMRAATPDTNKLVTSNANKQHKCRIEDMFQDQYKSQYKVTEMNCYEKKSSDGYTLRTSRVLKITIQKQIHLFNFVICNLKPIQYLFVFAFVCVCMSESYIRRAQHVRCP